MKRAKVTRSCAAGHVLLLLAWSFVGCSSPDPTVDETPTMGGGPQSGGGGNASSTDDQAGTATESQLSGDEGTSAGGQTGMEGTPVDCHSNADCVTDEFPNGERICSPTGRCVDDDNDASEGTVVDCHSNDDCITDEFPNGERVCSPTGRCVEDVSSDIDN